MLKKKFLLLLTILIFTNCQIEDSKNEIIFSGDIETENNLDKIHMNDDQIKAWATGYQNISYGSNVSDSFQTPEKAIGKAIGTSYDIVCLGRGGSITMTFEKNISNGDGYDFAIFENSISDNFLELAFVEVSSNGTNFIRFKTTSLTNSPVSAFGTIDPKLINGFAGRYKQGFGTCFDLETLKNNQSVKDGTVNLNNITHVKIIDIVGDGNTKDSNGNPIYDPYPTTGSAGFDLDAVGIINQSTN